MEMNFRYLNEVSLVIILMFSIGVSCNLSKRATINNRYVVTDFGAIPNDNKEDTEAFQVAIDKLRSSNINTLYIPKGEYILGSVNVSDNMIIIGEEGTLLKKTNHAGKWSRMFTTQNKYYIYKGRNRSKSLVFKNLILDGNFKNQGAYNKYQLEQQHLIFLTASNKQSGRLKVLIENCKFQNSVADGISVYKNIDIEIRDCEAENVFRGGVVVTGGNSKVVVDGLKTHGDIHNTGIDIEVDGKGYGDTYEVDISMINIDLSGDCDIGIRSGKFIGDNITCHNPPFHFLATRGSINISNSKFVGGSYKQSAIKFPKNVEFHDCIFELNDLNEKKNYAVNIYWSTNSYSGSDQYVLFDGCTFIRNGKPIKGRKAVGLYTHADDFRKKNVLEIKNTTFKGSFDYAYEMRQGGNVVLDNLLLDGVESIKFNSVNNTKYKHNYRCVIGKVVTKTKSTPNIIMSKDMRNSVIRK